MLPVETAFKIYTDLDGDPLDNGYIYIGQVNQNPITAPVTVYWDAAGTQPAAQPLRTLDGYIVRNGTPANIFYSASYSQLVQDKKRRQIYYSRNSDDYSIASFINNLISSIGSSLVGFIQAGVGAIARTMQDKAREIVSVKDFGAVGNGVTDDTAALNNARVYIQSRGGVLFFPVGTYIISTATALQFSTGEVVLRGEGFGSVIKAANSSNLASLVGYSGSGTFHIENLSIDGNKNNGGTIYNFAYLLYLSGLRAKIRNVELKNSVFSGAFLGSSATNPLSIEFEGCYIHDNGGIALNGNSCGIYAGGTFLAQDVRILNCHFEDNYNKVTAPGLANALNMAANSVSVIGCFFKNNLNANGGMIDIGDGGTGSLSSRMIISGNTIEQSVTFAADATSAIEVIGRKCVVTDNVIYGPTADGVRFEANAGDAVISNNVITCSAVGVNLINSGGTGIVNTSVRGNQILSASVGIQVQSGASLVVLESNYIGSGVTTKISGLVNCVLVRDNYGFNPTLATITTPAIPASAAPVTNNTHVDCNVYITAAAGGSVSVSIGGFAVATVPANTVSMFFLPAGSTITLTYVSAPTWTWLGQ